ncbi:MAG: hypothetical protein A3B68_04495 [Candidatus Melainabacteria bacterium RIFCSPHIGHO2_02_FULL_34_12]|nr:MAG: hypothetical protein A3B68_04495 [Candidatus Melainabacteria bacterium RIFCSPHIGHO2_02_FULL_34_12]
MKTYEKIYKLVKKIPKGKVATYGQIGQMLDLNPRVVGWALNRIAKGRIGEPAKRRKNNREKNRRFAPPPHRRIDSSIPWQRVINSKGSISTDRLMNIPLGLQKTILEKEGIIFDKQNKVNLKRYRWTKFKT